MRSRGSRRLLPAGLATAAVAALAAAACGAGDTAPSAWLVQLGPLEVEVSNRALEAVLWRDTFLFGDPHSNRRPVAYPILLTDKWQRLAEPEAATCQTPSVRQEPGRVVIVMKGQMHEREGKGRWAWTQENAFAGDGRLTIRYHCTQVREPDKPVRHHRFVFALNRNEVVAKPKRGSRTRKTPGQPFTIVDAEGQSTTRGFGESPNHYRQPRTVTMPFQGCEVPIQCQGAGLLELWNAGWGHRANFFLEHPRPAASAAFTLDLSALLDAGTQPLRVEEVRPRPAPWLTATIPPRAKPARPLRFAQCTELVTHMPNHSRLDPEATERIVREMAKHFDVVELMVAWADWKHAVGWGRDSKAKGNADRIAAKAQEWVDIGLKHGVEMALSTNFGDGEPGTGKLETRRQPQFHAETFDPATGAFHKQRDVFDWTNPEALAYARRAWFDAASKIKGMGFLFFNEPHYRLKCWHRAPFFSRPALDDFRRFCRDPAARFPAKPYAKPTDRTDHRATQADWRRWEDWVAAVYARRIRIQTEAVRAANQTNPRYKGAIWFQNVGWVGPEWGTDLDLICALPEVTYVVCEYCTNETSEHWRKFAYFAHKHGKKLSSFVNIANYDALAKGRFRFEGDDESFRRAVHMGVRERADMISLYSCQVMYPWAEAHHPSRTRIWDEVTRPYCLGR